MSEKFTEEGLGQKSGSRVIPFLLVVAACLGAGLFLGSAAGGSFSAPDKTGQAPQTFTFLGYDGFQVPTKLRGIWILELDGKGKARFFGISPATITTTKSGQTTVLKDFLADPLGAPARLYQVDLFPFPSTTVELDIQGFSVLINRIGGVRIEDRVFRGQDIVSLLEYYSTNPLEDLRFQSRIISAMFETAGPCPSESSLAGLQPAHLLAVMPVDMLISECTKRGPYLSGAVNVRILENVLPMDLPDGTIGLLPAE